MFTLWMKLRFGSWKMRWDAVEDWDGATIAVHGKWSSTPFLKTPVGAQRDRSDLQTR